MRLGPETDRYGRVVALVALPAAMPAKPSSTTLLAQGHARVAANIGDSACAASLLSAGKGRARRPALASGPTRIM